MIIKGTLITFDKSLHLLDFELDKPLDDVIHDLCKVHNLPFESSSYGLKIIENKDATHKTYYLTEENKHTLVHGCTLSLQFSIGYIVDLIFTHIRDNRFDSFHKLHTNATDPAFIKLLVKKNKYAEITKMMVEDNLKDMEAAACLLIILHLLRLQEVHEINYDLLQYIIKFALNDSNIKHVHVAYAVLSQILYLKGDYNRHKEKIISDISISSLLTRIKSNDDLRIHSNTLQLVNAMVRAVQGDKKLQLTKEMNMKANKRIIFEYVLSRPKIDAFIARELYVYQCNILSLHKSALNTYIDPTSNEMVRNEFDFNDFIPRSSTLIEFESDFTMKRSTSQDTILSNDDNRISIASVASVTTMKSGASYCSLDEQLEDRRISYLAFECLCHYKNNYAKNFLQSQTEENTYEPGIFLSSERVTKLLAKLLRIEREPAKNSQQYLPLIFNPTFKHEFFPELFCRTMWLLSKTRREMKASIYDDYDKVLKVLRQQVLIVLDTKPKDYNELLDAMKKCSYNDVSEKIMKEHKIDLDRILKTNPCIQELKKSFKDNNEKLVLAQRMGVLQKGADFPKFDKKIKDAKFHAQLSLNQQTLHIKLKSNESKISSKKESYNISNIRHFIVGKACPHFKDNTVKNYRRAFSIQFEDDCVINFYAMDELMAQHWIDGFNLLLGKDNRSESYHKELANLVEMDCILQLLDLQNVRIPSGPPTVPPPPEIVRPKVPARSPALIAKLRARQNRGPSLMINNNGLVGESNI